MHNPSLPGAEEICSELRRCGRCVRKGREELSVTTRSRTTSPASQHEVRQGHHCVEILFRNETCERPFDVANCAQHRFARKCSRRQVWLLAGCRILTVLMRALETGSLSISEEPGSFHFGETELNGRRCSKSSVRHFPQACNLAGKGTHGRSVELHSLLHFFVFLSVLLFGLPGLLQTGGSGGARGPGSRCFGRR